MDRTVDRISAYAASLSASDVTPEALRAVKRSLVDSVGCALGALFAEPVKIGRWLAGRVSSDMPASVIGTSIKTSPEVAAFANGVMVRYLDFNDDYINYDGPHPSDNIPAVLAMAESVHADGRSLALGITLAYEIVGQLVDSVGFCDRGWDYVTETSIGSALGAGKVLGLSRPQMAQALSLAIAPNITLRQTRVGELSMWKGCAGPNAARNGVFAALLAWQGMTGPEQCIEGKHGLWNQVTGRFDLGTFGDKTHRFKIQDTFFKPIPVVYPGLLPVETALELRNQVDINSIESIKVVVDNFIMTHGSNSPEKWDPHTRETADHSIAYLVVAALVDGEITEKTLTPARYRAPNILAILKRLTMVEDPEYTREFPGTYHCRIEVTDKSGQHVLHRKNPKGHPANPMSDAEIEDKFLRLTQGTLKPENAKHALHLMWHLEDVDDVGKILDAVSLEGK